MKKLGIVLLNSLIILNVSFSMNCCAMSPQQQKKYGNYLVKDSDFFGSLKETKDSKCDETKNKVKKYIKINSLSIKSFIHKQEYVSSNDVVRRTDIFRPTDSKEDVSEYSIIFNIDHLKRLPFFIILSDITLNHITNGNYQLEKYEGDLELQKHTGGHTSIAYELLKMICNSDQLGTEQKSVAREHIEKIDYLFDKKVEGKMEIAKLIQKILTKLPNGDFYDNTLQLQINESKKNEKKPKKERKPKKEIHVYVEIKNVGYAVDPDDDQPTTNLALLILKHKDDLPDYNPRILYKVDSFYPVRNIPTVTPSSKIIIYIKGFKEYDVSELLKDGEK